MKRNVENIITLLNEFVNISSKTSAANSEISNWNVYQHIEHILLVNTNIFKIIFAKSLDDVKTNPTKLIAYFVLSTKYIPRGRNKTPENLIPCETDKNKIINELKDSVIELRSKLGEIEQSVKLPGKYNHHVFGGLNRKQWLRFMYVHTLHHYKIVSDIIT